MALLMFVTTCGISLKSFHTEEVMTKAQKIGVSAGVPKTKKIKKLRLKGRMPLKNQSVKVFKSI